MNTKQIFLITILFIIALVLMTLPVWIDRALPIMFRIFNTTAKTFEDMWVALKFISDKLAQDLTRLLDKYVFGS